MPGGGDEELRSTVFDESFIQAAQLEEYSARQRLEDETFPVRDRAPGSGAGLLRTLPKQGLALTLVVLTALVFAVFLGNNAPYGTGAATLTPPPRATVLPLAPGEAVPGGEPAELYAGSEIADFGVGAAGVTLPEAARTESFTREQVGEALALAKEYVVASALNPEVLTGTTALPVRTLLGPDQQRQLDRSLADRPGESAATGWLVRFDPGAVTLADARVRVDGEVSVTEAARRLEVTAVHVTAYAVRPAEQPQDPASLFWVHRELRMSFGDEGLRDRQAVLLSAQVLAGPMDCATDPARELQPLLAGQQPGDPAGTDPRAWSQSPRPCGALADLTGLAE